jgi:predicted flap endonuclease-1-like 5' DNA nuclease
METNSLIAIILDVGVALFFLYALYYTSQQRKKKAMTTVTPEPKPQTPAIESPKAEPVQPIPEPKPQTTVIETPKAEPIQPISPKPQSAVVETLKAEPNHQAKAGPKPKQAQPITEKKEHGFNIIDIEGIGPVYSEKLHAIKLYNTSDLLKAGSTPRGRRELAEKTGISPELILEWVNLSDLFRIKGIGEEYSDLLEEAGVDTVVELSHRNAANLHAKILEVNEAKKLVRRPPPLASVESWINEAKTLPRVIEY